MEEQVCVCIVSMYERKRRLMIVSWQQEKNIFSSTTNINFNLIVSVQSLCFKSEAAEDRRKIDEQPDVSDVSFDVHCG